MHHLLDCNVDWIACNATNLFKVNLATGRSLIDASCLLHVAQLLYLTMN